MAEEPPSPSSSNVGYVIGGACVVLFGFMFYKQTMLQAELKRLKAELQANENRNNIQRQVEEQFANTSNNLTTQATQSDPEPQPERYVPAPRQLPPSAIESHNRKKSEQFALPEVAEVASHLSPAETEPSFIPAMPDDSESPHPPVEELDAATARQIDEIVRAARSSSAAK